MIISLPLPFDSYNPACVQGYGAGGYPAPARGEFMTLLLYYRAGPEHRVGGKV